MMNIIIHSRTSRTIHTCLVLFCAMIFFAGFTARSQVREQNAVGVIAMFDYSIHEALFRGLPGVASCCPEYGTTTGTGYTIGVEYSRRLSDEFTFFAGLLYSGYNVEFLEDETELLSIDGKAEHGIFEHSINASFSMIGIEPLLSYRIIQNLSIGAGVNVAIPVSATYDQKEELVSPEYGVFLDTGSRIRNKYSGDIANTASALLSGIIVLRMRVPLNNSDSFVLDPEIAYVHAFSDVVKDIVWKPHSVRIGLALSKRF